MGILGNKKVLRKEILEKRGNVDLNIKKELDKAILNKFYESSYYKNANKIFIYVSYNSELDTKEIINKALEEGKRIFVPRTEYKTKSMDAVKITSLDDLQESGYGILEPSIDEEAIDPNKLDLIVVPGVAFDKCGGRIGYGAGYYDRYFKKITNENLDKIKKVVLAYDLQIIEHVPMNEFDVFIDYIISEKQSVNCRTEKRNKYKNDI